MKNIHIKMLAKKKLGQHFLINQNVINKIADAIKNEIIYEIGPGYGALTEKLLANNKKVIAIEIDNDCLEFLQISYKKDVESDNLQLINQDVLQYIFPYASVIGNLPYNISTKIIEKFIYNPIKEGVFMLQKEVAQRLLENNRLGIFVQSRYNVMKIVDVSADSFIPKPKVASRVIKLIEHSNSSNLNYKKLDKILRIVFHNPRKQINSIKNIHPDLFFYLTQYVDSKSRPAEIDKNFFYLLAKNDNFVIEK